MQFTFKICTKEDRKRLKTFSPLSYSILENQKEVYKKEGFIMTFPQQKENKRETQSKVSTSKEALLDMERLRLTFEDIKVVDEEDEEEEESSADEEEECESSDEEEIDFNEEEESKESESSIPSDNEEEEEEQEDIDSDGDDDEDTHDK